MPFLALIFSFSFTLEVLLALVVTIPPSVEYLRPLRWLLRLLSRCPYSISMLYLVFRYLLSSFHDLTRLGDHEVV